jgi:hypothetical protein
MKGEGRERGKPLAKIEQPVLAVGAWLEVGGQGVLFHRKEQGLWAYRVHRTCNSASAIVSKRQWLTLKSRVPRG